MARAKHQPSEKQLIEAEAFATVGVPHHQIATLMGISIKTLLRYYSAQLEVGKAKASYKVAKRLYETATGAAMSPQVLSALIYWTKSQMGWRETQLVQSQLLDANGRPINPLQPPSFRVSFDAGAPGLAPAAGAPALPAP